MARKKKTAAEAEGAEKDIRERMEALDSERTGLHQTLVDMGVESPDEEEPAQPPPGMVPLSAVQDIANTLRDAVVQSAPIKKVSVGRYEPRSPIHRRALKKDVPRLKRLFMENGNVIREYQLSIEEIHLINLIERPGRYVGRKVEVLIKKDGGLDGQELIQIRYTNKRDNMDELNRVVDEYRNSQDEVKPARSRMEMMLQQVVAEAAKRRGRSRDDDDEEAVA